jgi:hypothetical protein
MPSTISAGTTAGTALNFTSDTTGNLAFQTNGTTTALSIDTNQNVTFANNVTYTGNIQGATITATTAFSGNGAAISAINASNVSSGTLASARLPTVPVSSGGTGITTTPSNGQIPIGNGTTYTAATLTQGSGISITNGAGSITIAATSTGLPGAQGQVFTSNGTFTIPSGITALKLTVVGGGGGSGGTQNAAYTNSGGGGGGGAAIKYLTGLTPGGTLSVTIGSAGSAGSTASNGGTGGTSSVASGTQSITTVSATGGGGSTWHDSNPQIFPAGTGGSGSNGDLNINGQAGGNGFGFAFSCFGTYAMGGNGGSSILGGGGWGGNSGSTGSSGGARGAGGGGSAGNLKSGAAGSAGVVMFEW